MIAIDWSNSKLLSHFVIPDALCNKLQSHFVIPDALCVLIIFDNCCLSYFVIIVSLCNTNFLYYLQKLKKICIWIKFWENDEIVPNLPITWILITWSGDKLKPSKVTITKTKITRHGGNTYQNETLPFLHVSWRSHVIIWQITTKLGKSAYNNERVIPLHFTWPNHVLTWHTSTKLGGNTYQNERIPNERVLLPSFQVT